MRKDKMFLIIGMMSIGVLCSCQSIQAENKEEVPMVQGKLDEDAELKWMMDTYGFTKEELEGVDLIKFIKRFDLYHSNMTSDEVKSLLNSLRDKYVDDGSSKLFHIFDTQPGGKLKKEDVIKKVAFVYNQGTFQQNFIFDLENNVWYVDDATPHTLTAEQKATITGLAEKCDVYSWDNEYKGKERDSTGSLYWKLAFVLADDSLCVYSGYTQDGSHLPATYGDVLEAVTSIVKNMEQ